MMLYAFVRLIMFAVLPAPTLLPPRHCCVDCVLLRVADVTVRVTVVVTGALPFCCCVMHSSLRVLITVALLRVAVCRALPFVVAVRRCRYAGHVAFAGCCVAVCYVCRCRAVSLPFFAFVRVAVRVLLLGTFRSPERSLRCPVAPFDLRCVGARL